MKTLSFLIGLGFFSFSLNSIAGTCDIYIHGYTADEKATFGDFPHQIVWNSHRPLAEATPVLAQNILKEIEKCTPGDAVILRPHSYGAAAVFYILGQGRRFESLYPEHDYVKVYKKVSTVYSYAGGYKGTPLMDILCSNKFTKWIAPLFKNKCVPSLTTSPIQHASNEVTNPGVPIHLIYSANYKGHMGMSDPIIGTYGVSWSDYLFKRIRNQHDSVLPQFSTRGCAEVQLMTDPNQNCRKIDADFFLDFIKVPNAHNEMDEDERLMKIQEEETTEAE